MAASPRKIPATLIPGDGIGPEASQAFPRHIIQRGNNRIACFVAEQVYRFYLRHTEELAQRFQCCRSVSLRH